MDKPAPGIITKSRGSGKIWAKMREATRQGPVCSTKAGIFDDTLVEMRVTTDGSVSVPGSALSCTDI